MKSEIEEFIELTWIGYVYLILVTIIILIWIHIRLYEIFGIAGSILILCFVFIVPPILLFCYLKKKKIRDKIEIREMENRFFDKYFQKKHSDKK